MPDHMLPAEGNLTLYRVLTAEAARWPHVHAFADGNRPVAFIGHLWGEPQDPQGEPPRPDLTRRFLGLATAAQDEALLSRGASHQTPPTWPRGPHGRQCRLGYRCLLSNVNGVPWDEAGERA